MRATVFAILATMAGLMTAGPSQATSVSAFTGNDTGGIIAYSLYTSGVDIKALAVNHCAGYGKGVKLTGVQANEGGYISFACIWMNPNYSTAPLRSAY